MYQAPMGRPISSPPADNHDGSAIEYKPKRVRRWGRLPDAIRDAIRSDYAAGMSWRDIEAKHRVTNGVALRAVNDLARTTPPASKPKRGGWTVRNRAEWAVKMRDGVRMSFKEEERMARRTCAKLNRTELMGTWMTARQCVEANLCKTKSGVNQRAALYQWERQKWRDNARFVIVLVPHADKWGRQLSARRAAAPAPAPAPEPPVALPMPLPPPPTFWQRIRGWLWS